MIKGFIEGVKNAYGSIMYLYQHKSLWKWVWLPFMINVLMFVLCVKFGFSFYESAFEMYRNDRLELKMNTDIGMMWHAMKYMYLFFRFLLKGLLITVTLSLIYYALSCIAASPCYDFLSLKVEEIECRRLTRDVFSWKGSILLPIGNACFLMLLETGACLIGFPLNWIPVIGSLMYMSIIAVLLAINAMSYSFERRNIGVLRILRLYSREKGAFFGLGAFCVLTLLIPFFGMCLLPLCVIAGTRQFLMFLSQNKI